MTYSVLSLTQRENLARNVRNVLAARNHNASDFCRAVNSSNGVLRCALSPVISWTPSVNSLQKLATYCGCTIERMLDEEVLPTQVAMPGAGSAPATLQDLTRQLAAMPYITIQMGRENTAMRMVVEHGRFEVTAPGGISINNHVHLLEDGMTFRLGDMEVSLKHVG